MARLRYTPLIFKCADEVLLLADQWPRPRHKRLTALHQAAPSHISEWCCAPAQARPFSIYRMTPCHHGTLLYAGMWSAQTSYESQLRVVLTYLGTCDIFNLSDLPFHVFRHVIGHCKTDCSTPKSNSHTRMQILRDRLAKPSRGHFTGLLQCFFVPLISIKTITRLDGSAWTQVKLGRQGVGRTSCVIRATHEIRSWS